MRAIEAFESAVYTGGSAEAIAVVRGLQDKEASLQVSEATINSMGYWLLGRDRTDEGSDEQRHGRGRGRRDRGLR